MLCNNRLKKEKNMIIDGKAIATQIKQQIKQEIKATGIEVCLAVVLVGNNPASITYVKNKKIACEKVGIKSLEIWLDENTTQEQLNQKLDDLSENVHVHAILLQLPLPKHLNERQALTHIAQHKDVDGLTNASLGGTLSQDTQIFACTPKGVVHLIETVCPSLEGKHAVVVGKSNLVGKPLAVMLLNKGATVTVCHSKTVNLISHTRTADIVISATGHAGLITKKHIKKGAIVIDVGISKNQQGKIVGDVLFDEVAKKASYITPVPGGVGPMTIAMLLQNALILAKQQNKIY
jgi:methylenetetrahydrofolate dehydrogenase (NADP+)/methenyltetrahydrofolate cyclohydrolase